MPKNNYVLSSEADLDLDDIFEYTYEEFGMNQAVKYLSDIEEIPFKITFTPEMGRTRNEIKVGLYSIPCGKHVIFYRILSNHIRIVRVLYGAKDIPKNFNQL